MDKKILTFVGAGVVAAGAAAFMLLGGPGALSHSPGGKKGQRTVTAKVGSFDANADTVLDLDKYGSERPDDYAVQEAFNGTFGALDECVAAEKKRTKSDDQILGDVEIEVLLSPHKDAQPKVNAKMPDGVSSKLTDCVREAAAKADYPKYDGPPVVARFSFELDPGYTEE